MSKEQAKDALIEVLMNQVVDLTMMSKIELGDDVIAEIKRLKEIINQNKMSEEELDNFLLKLLNADKVGIRRKLIAMKNFLEENTILLNQNKDE